MTLRFEFAVPISKVAPIVAILKFLLLNRSVPLSKVTAIVTILKLLLLNRSVLISKVTAIVAVLKLFKHIRFWIAKDNLI